MERIPETGAVDLPEEVESYDRLSKRFLGLVEKKFVRRCLKLLNKKKVQKSSFILDVGTATANIPVRFVQELEPVRVVALDLSLKMLEKAGINIKNAGYGGRVFLVCGAAGQLPFKDESFDLVYSHSTMHHLPGPLEALTEIVRVARTGCPFIIRDLRRPPACLLELYVRIFGFPYDALMKKMYRESLRAGFSYKEMKNFASEIESAVVKTKMFFITHVGLEGYRFVP